MRQVIIMSGVSGCGKSTYAKSLCIPHGVANSHIVSADTYFMSDGVYKFDASKLSDAHGACFKQFITYMQESVSLVVVDNTNTTAEEIAPYILGAQAFGYEVEIRTLLTDMTSDKVVALSDRNLHGVGPNSIMAQSERLVRRKLMPWWKNTDIEAKV